MQIIVIVAVLAVAVAALFWYTRQLGGRFNSALGGKSPGSLESNFADYFGRIKVLEKRSDLTTETLEKLATQIDLASQKISIVRFNPFGDTGGDQSFSLAVLDAHNSGYVITSIHGRENTRTYIKPIDLGHSKHTLSKEEKQAIDQATKRVPKFKVSEQAASRG